MSCLTAFQRFTPQEQSYLEGCTGHLKKTLIVLADLSVVKMGLKPGAAYDISFLVSYSGLSTVV